MRCKTQVCTISERPGGLDRFWQPFEPVTDHDAHVVGAAVLDLGEHLQPELCALSAGADPDPQDVSSAVRGDPDRA